MKASNGKFQRWVDESGGTYAVAEKIDSSPKVVQHWYRRKGYPSVAYMKRLIVASEFKLSFDSIIFDTDPNPLAKA